MTIDKAKYKVALAELQRVEAWRKELLAPSVEAHQSALAAIEEITDGDEVIGTCERCGEPIFDGEPSDYMGEGLYYCEEHSRRWSDVVQAWEDAVAADADAWSEMFESRADFDAWIAGRKAIIATDGDEKLVKPASPLDAIMGGRK